MGERVSLLLVLGLLVLARACSCSLVLALVLTRAHAGARSCSLMPRIPRRGERSAPWVRDTRWEGEHLPCWACMGDGDAGDALGGRPPGGLIMGCVGREACCDCAYSGGACALLLLLPICCCCCCCCVGIHLHPPPLPPLPSCLHCPSLVMSEHAIGGL
ncbi:uncharacterized protein K452DRAFT_38428 [Aplosporella prunicola CBS 121167]|uniref:Uncharacterized protein n=1 Tax=Aplosporella prunicola CBS 121167 TaxID=1176127 RepID=A0A6A6BAW6_9PEZI|nr:uncharacterized protein K452DRAFT_38428 [Aplosporella prunicola CBS 121167]KAF2141359.1 hypothetical protein K452DRAFT_38428 [Aplosporella prunicola CBS 121167]